MTDGEAGEVLRTRGRYLVHHFWGSYIAIFQDEAARDCYVMRDSSGQLPCYTVACGGVAIVAAHIADLSGLPLAPFSLNRRYLAAFIFEAELAHGDCGLTDIREVLAGQRLELHRPGAIPEPLWDPREICRRSSVANFADACHEVQVTTQHCVDRWASQYDRIIHLSSGGLDSSVIAACLKRSPRRPVVTCLHLQTDATDVDESSLAALSADSAGFDIVFQAGYSSNAGYDDRIFRLPKSAKPSVANLGITLEPDLQNSLPLKVHAQAIWDGQGGDHLFFDSHTALTAVDYAFRHGVGGGWSSAVRDAIRLSRRSYWDVLGQSLRFGLLRCDWRPERRYNSALEFLNPELTPAEMTNYIWQPWQDDASDLPPGKRWQIMLLARLIHRHRPVPELQYAGEQHPFFSQPLVELCLRIPTHVLLQGGVNRALERSAFRDYVPERIIQRHNKGTVATTVMNKIRECLPFVRDLVLDGVLVQERIIAKSTLEPYLAGNKPISQRLLWPLLSCIAAEAWARQWTRDGGRI